MANGIVNDLRRARHRAAVWNASRYRRRRRRRRRRRGRVGSENRPDSGEVTEDRVEAVSWVVDEPVISPGVVSMAVFVAQFTVKSRLDERYHA
jgi:hypothetical protein